MVQEDHRRHRLPGDSLVQLPGRWTDRCDRLDHPELLPGVVPGCRPGRLQCECFQGRLLLHDYRVATGYRELYMGSAREQIRAASYVCHQLCKLTLTDPRLCCAALETAWDPRRREDELQ